MSKILAVDILDESHSLTIEELCEHCQVEITWIEELEAQGIIGSIEGSGRFAEVTVNVVRTARRLEQDLGLNVPGIALAMELLSEIDRLKGELRRRG
jgi:chaperone modulatory protein CbpM